MKVFLLLMLFANTIQSIAQKQTYDLVSYNPPAGWKKEVKTNMTVYTMTDNKKSSWCQIFLVKSTTSKGSIEADFESEWRSIVAPSVRRNYFQKTAVASLRHKAIRTNFESLKPHWWTR